MAGAPFWGLNDQGASCAQGLTYADDPWDGFEIADMPLPGICEVRGTGVVFDMIVKKSKGQNGARITYGGYDPKQFEVAVTIATKVQWELFQEVCDVLLALKSTAPKGTDFVFDVSHPDLARLHIDRATIIGMPPATKADFDGGKVFVIKFQEYFPRQARNVTKTATASVSVVKPLRYNQGHAPVNSAPVPPSSHKANLSLKGPPAHAHGE